MNLPTPFFPSPPETQDDVLTFCESLMVSLMDYITAINDMLTGQVDTTNLKVYLGHVADTGLADAEITITHSLGATPIYFLANIDKAGSVYASRRNEWTDYVMYVKCSAANADLYILVLE